MFVVLTVAVNLSGFSGRRVHLLAPIVVIEDRLQWVRHTRSQTQPDF